MLDTFAVETTPIILIRELKGSFVKRACDKMTLSREVGYGYVSRPDGEKVTPSWLKEGNYQIESRGRKYEATLHMKTPFDPSNDRIQGRYDAVGRETESQHKQQERQSGAMH